MNDFLEIDVISQVTVIVYFLEVSVQGVKSLGGHFACLCLGFDFYEVKKNCIV